MTIGLTIKGGTTRQYPQDGNEDWGTEATNWANDATVAINNMPNTNVVFQCAAIVGSAADVAAGIATHTDIATAIGAVAAGDRIAVLDGTYSQAAVLQINKAVTIIGQGSTTIINSTAGIAAGPIVQITVSGVSISNIKIDDGAGTPDYALTVDAGLTDLYVQILVDGTYALNSLNNLSDSMAVFSSDAIAIVGGSDDLHIQAKDNDSAALSIGSAGDPTMIVLDTTTGATKINLNAALDGTHVLDEDNMASDSATAVPTQQSVKAYVDAAASAMNEFTELTDTPASYAGEAEKLVKVNAAETALEFFAQSSIDHNALTNTHDLTTDIDHNSITNTHDLTTDIDHNSITNTHDLTTDIDHNSITNTHNLTTDIDHDSITNTHQDVSTTASPTFVNPTASGELRLVESAAGTDNYTGFKAPADLGAANVIYTMPGADGGAGDVLSTSGGKVLSWISPSATSMPTGTIIVSVLASTSPPTGYIPCTNKTIGKTGAGADYEGTTYQALFDLLWALPGISTTAGHPFKLSAAAGASAADDWNAGKTIAIDFATNELFIRQDGGTTTLGAYQASANICHCHTGTTDSDGNHTNIINRGSSAGGACAVVRASSCDGALGATVASTPAHCHAFTSAGTGESEARPKNVALNYFIKY